MSMHIEFISSLESSSDESTTRVAIRGPNIYCRALTAQYALYERLVVYILLERVQVPNIPNDSVDLHIIASFATL